MGGPHRHSDEASLQFIKASRISRTCLSLRNVTGRPSITCPVVGFQYCPPRLSLLSNPGGVNLRRCHHSSLYHHPLSRNLILLLGILNPRILVAKSGTRVDGADNQALGRRPGTLMAQTPSSMESRPRF